VTGGAARPEHGGECLDDVFRGCDEGRALLQEIVGAGRAGVEGVSRDGENLAALLAGQPRRDERS
jgi:hypothetical protein